MSLRASATYRLVVLTALVAGTQAQPPFRVGGLALDSPAHFSGDCRKLIHVHFNGRINATGAGDVTYQWVRSDNANAPVETLHFSHPGPMPVSYDWGMRGSATGWVAFRILSPNRLQSNKVSFRINCRD